MAHEKISLDPGWRFTKRTYQGRELGHVYLTYDSVGWYSNQRAEYYSSTATTG